MYELVASRFCEACLVVLGLLRNTEVRGGKMIARVKRLPSFRIHDSAEPNLPVLLLVHSRSCATYVEEGVAKDWRIGIVAEEGRRKVRPCLTCSGES